MLDVTLSDRLVDVVDEGYDLAVRISRLQPSFLVGTHLAAGTLVEVLPNYRSIELGVYAVYPSRKHLAPRVRALIDFLIEAFRTRPWPA